jgi:hypothetical protein
VKRYHAASSLTSPSRMKTNDLTPGQLAALKA